ncbi:sulfatase [Microbacterium sp. KUDC0406]|uniref:sulfatase n=1 Tax=Microbacterium sp. KUDC0406 TaxID=2909588 RepID=UPI001F18B36D|nr:sulfatase [Microbacterium sp. KUDC0406]UJP09597.1 sulfatase [Microbacterium sp. KUDC0406]
MVMFDSLNRRYLPPYGATRVHAPNFRRLAARTVRFLNCYAGSMPCMPARRELHTGRHNFLHREWGPLEPFDDSMPELLRDSGVYTHLVTDHRHYWGDGGATFHGRYSSFEFIRGQEGDAWQSAVIDPETPDIAPELQPRDDSIWRHDWANRRHMTQEADHPQTRTFDGGIAFLRENAREDDWFLTIESYDPHEPFFSPERFQRLYETDYDGPHQDWPSYRKVLETESQADHLRAQYQALVSMCDESLGRVLDVMDELDLWHDTLLIVCTDHGLMLGEQGWWGKGVQPWYDENIHTPLFVRDPRHPAEGVVRDALVQTIDIPATVLEYFAVPRPNDMQGRSLDVVLRDDERVHDAALFGSFGGHVNVTDGRYIYMRAPLTACNEPLSNFTLMPVHAASRFSAEELSGAELVAPMPFTKGMPLLKTPASPHGNPYHFGSMLFDLEDDPGQEHLIVDDEIELRLATLLVQLMRDNDAPDEQFVRLGLPDRGPVQYRHLLLRAQHERAATARKDPPVRALFHSASPVVARSVAELCADDRARATVENLFPDVMGMAGLASVSRRTLWEIALILPSVTTARLRELEKELSSEGKENV